MFPFTAQHEEVKRSRKTAVRKGEKKQRSTETCEAAILHLTLELPTFCADSVELRVSLWSSRSRGSKVMEQVYEACASLRKVPDFYLKKTPKNGRNKNKSDIQLFLGSYYVKMLQEAQWREMGGNQDVVQTRFLFCSLGVLLNSLHSKVVYEVFYRWMHSLSKV